MSDYWIWCGLALAGYALAIINEHNKRKPATHNRQNIYRRQMLHITKSR